MNDYEIGVEGRMKRLGRVVTGWWDGQPIHRRMTVDEQAIKEGIDPLTVEFGIALLANPNFKPRYELS